MAKPSSIDRSGGPNACWPWTKSLDSKGYGQFWSKGKLLRAHRAAFQAANGYMPVNVLHTCDFRACCNPAHLYDGTLKQNTQDMMRRGRNKFKAFVGSAHGRALLTEADVRVIKKSTATQQALADKYGVSRAAIGMILCGKNWSHV